MGVTGKGACDMRYVWQEAREQAQRILDECWDGRTLPIDVVALCKLNGVTPYRTNLSDDRSGMIIKLAGENGANAYVDSLEPHVRRRFTFAHELGHFIERKAAGDDEYGFSEYRSGHSRNYFPHEFYADEFAGALLMPESKIREFEDEGLDAAGMAGRFDVSVAAMRRRLRALERSKAVEGGDADGR